MFIPVRQTFIPKQYIQVFCILYTEGETYEDVEALVLG